MLAERGFRVVRFDNRDIGHSTMIDAAGMPRRIDMMRGRRDRAPYLLTDMADDAFGLMDHLGIESAHVVGASMGGMIGQTMAIERPERVRSLVSMMSTTGNRRLGWPHWRALPILFADYPRSREAYIRQVNRTFEVIGSPGFPRDPQRLAGSGGADVGPLPQPGGRAPPDARGHGLRRPNPGTAAASRLPATVLHGTADPLVRPAGGRATAEAIPGARLRMFKGMGHDLPRQLWPEFVEEIAATAERASGSTSAESALRSRIASSAAERSRTFTAFRPHGPEPCASTSSATAARSRQCTCSRPR